MTTNETKEDIKTIHTKLDRMDQVMTDIAAILAMAKEINATMDRIEEAEEDYLPAVFS